MTIWGSVLREARGAIPRVYSPKPLILPGEGNKIINLSVKRCTQLSRARHKRVFASWTYAGVLR
jgi:hypothetical protein